MTNEETKISPEIYDIVKQIVECGISGETDVIGCKAEEIAELEAIWGCTLPRRYRQFLQVMGRGAGKFFQGTDIFYPAARHLKEWTRELLKEDVSGFKLPADAITFAMHQGYQFIYFELGGGDDPAIYHYMEGNGTAKCVSSSLSKYIMTSSFDEW